MLGGEQLAAGVDGEDVVEVGRGDVLQGVEVLDARARCEDIEPPELLYGLIDEELGLVGVGDVGAEREGTGAVGAERGDQVLRRLLVAPVADDDGGPLPGQPGGDRRADASAAAGDDGDLARESRTVHCCHRMCSSRRWLSPCRACGCAGAGVRRTAAGAGVRPQQAFRALPVVAARCPHAEANTNRRESFTSWVSYSRRADHDDIRGDPGDRQPGRRAPNGAVAYRRSA